MFDFEDLKLEKNFANKKEYERFKKWVLEYFTTVQYNYSYLGLPDNVWQNFFVKINKMAFHKTTYNNIKRYIMLTLDKNVKGYVSFLVSHNKIGVLNNLFVSVFKRSSNYYQALKGFYEQLHFFQVELSYQNFLDLKAKCPLFSKTLAVLKIPHITKNELYSYLNSTNVYLSLKPFSFSYNEVKSTVNYILSLLEFREINILDFTKDSPSYKRVKFLLDHYSKIEKIVQSYINIYGQVSERELHKVLFNYSLKKLESVFLLIQADKDICVFLIELHYHVTHQEKYSVKDILPSLSSYLSDITLLEEQEKNVLIEIIFNHIDAQSKKDILDYFLQDKKEGEQSVKNFKAIYLNYLYQPLFNLWFFIYIRYGMMMVCDLDLEYFKEFSFQVKKYQYNHSFLEYEIVKEQILTSVFEPNCDFLELVDHFLLELKKLEEEPIKNRDR